MYSILRRSLFLPPSDNIILDLDINMGQALPSPEWMICGKYGTATIPIGTDKWQVKYYKPEEAPEILADKKMAAADRCYPSENLPWIEEIIEPEPEFEDFYYNKCYEYFALNQEPFVTTEQTREVMRLIEECRSSNDE